MKKLLTFVVGAAAVAGAAYWAVRYLTGCEKPQSIYPDIRPQDAAGPDDGNTSQETVSVEQTDESDDPGTSDM